VTGILTWEAFGVILVPLESKKAPTVTVFARLGQRRWICLMVCEVRVAEEESMGQYYYDHGTRDDRIFIGLSLLLVVVSIYALVSCSRTLGWISVVVVDLYVIALLTLSAMRSRDAGFANRNQWSYGFFPSRVCGLLVAPALIVGLTCGFAALYLGTNVFEIPKTRLAALYASVSTLGFNDFQPKAGYGQWIVVVHLASVILLLMGVWALLMSRISSFESPVKTPTDSEKAEKDRVKGLLTEAVADFFAKQEVKIAALDTENKKLKGELEAAEKKLNAASGKKSPEA
jgi:hypothetical protein